MVRLSTSVAGARKSNGTLLIGTARQNTIKLLRYRERRRRLVTRQWPARWTRFETARIGGQRPGNACVVAQRFTDPGQRGSDGPQARKTAISETGRSRSHLAGQSTVTLHKVHRRWRRPNSIWRGRAGSRTRTEAPLNPENRALNWREKKKTIHKSRLRYNPRMLVPHRYLRGRLAIPIIMFASWAWPQSLAETGTAWRRPVAFDAINASMASFWTGIPTLPLSALVLDQQTSAQAQEVKATSAQRWDVDAARRADDIRRQVVMAYGSPEEIQAFQAGKAYERVT